MYSTQSEKQSYALGFDIGQSLKAQGLEFALDIFFTGFRDAFEQQALKISESDMRSALEQLQHIMQEKDEQMKTAQAAKNHAVGAEFLAANAKKEGVKTLPSGLQYRELKAGSGNSPGLRDEVTTHYHGTLIDGSVFDSSFERGEPVRFPVAGVIKGWTEALQLMKEGSVWELYIPSDLAYGPRGAGEDIEPNSTLIFKVELIKVHR